MEYVHPEENLWGQRIYILRLAAKRAPRVLRDLYELLPRWQAWRPSFATAMVYEMPTWEALEQAAASGNAEAAACHQGLKKWGERRGLAAPWIWQVAMRTLDLWAAHAHSPAEPRMWEAAVRKVCEVDVPEVEAPPQPLWRLHEEDEKHYLARLREWRLEAGRRYAAAGWIPADSAEARLRNYLYALWWVEHRANERLEGDVLSDQDLYLTEDRNEPYSHDTFRDAIAEIDTLFGIAAPIAK